MEAVDAGLGGGGLGEDSLAGGCCLFEVVVPAYFPGGVLEHEEVVVGEVYGVEEFFAAVVPGDQLGSKVTEMTEPARWIGKLNHPPEAPL